MNRIVCCRRGTQKYGPSERKSFAAVLHLAPAISLVTDRFPQIVQPTMAETSPFGPVHGSGLRIGITDLPFLETEAFRKSIT